MLKTTLVGAALLVPGLALACGGDKGTTAQAATPAGEQVAVAVAEKDPTACAKKADLVGANCSYTTGMMAQRVMSEGSNWSFTGTLAPSTNELTSHVAAPFTVGPDSKVHVVANEILEGLTVAGMGEQRVTLGGKKLDVDGVTYFVLTDYTSPNS